MNEYTTRYPRDGRPVRIPAGFTGLLKVWGADLVPDVFRVEDGRVVETVYRARGDWTAVR